MAMNESGLRTFTAGETLAICRRVKLDASQNVVYADADDLGIGTTEQAASSGEAISIRLWNSPGTRKLTCSEAVAAGADLYGADDGKVTDTVASDRNIIAEALQSGSGNGAIIETILRGGSAGSPTDSLVTEALSDLSDVSGKTGTGSTVVMDVSPTIVTPTLDVPAIDEFTSAQHDHSDASNGGTIGFSALGISGSGNDVIGLNASGATLEAKAITAGTNIESIVHTAGVVTINGKTDPTIDDFSNAGHDHADASGGGQLDSTAFSSITGSGGVVLENSPTLTTPTLDVPAIDEFTSATHDHADASGGGQLDSTAFSSVTGSGGVVLENGPTLDVPAIDDFTSATHDHADASGGGQLTGSAFSDKTGSGTTVVLSGNPTITTPAIADFSSSTHDHEDAAGGGTLDLDAISEYGSGSQLLGMNTGASGLEYKTLIAGTGISLTPAAGQITIAASAKEIAFTQTFADHYADGTNNNCDSIREWDNTDKVVYNKITALASGAPLQSLQCIFAIQLPSSFTGWEASTALQITYKTIDSTPYVQVMSVVDSAGAEISAGFPAAAQNAAKSTLTVTAAMLSTGTWTPGTVVYVKVKGYGNTGTPFSTETAMIGPVKANFA